MDIADEPIDELDFIREIGTVRRKYLKSIGLNTIKKVANADINYLLKPSIGLNESTAVKVVLSAKSLSNKRVYRLDEFKLPVDPIYLDVETSLFLDAFMFGVFLPKEKLFQQFTIHNVDDSKEKAKVEKEFYRFIASLKGTIVTYSGYDSHYLSPVLETGKFELYDLYKEIKRAFVLPCINYKLKTVAPFFGYVRKTKLDGIEIPSLYSEYQSTKNKKIIKEIKTYNKDDVMMMPFLIAELKKSKAEPI